MKRIAFLFVLLIAIPAAAQKVANTTQGDLPSFIEVSDLDSPCADGEVLKASGGGWVCAADATGEGGGDSLPAGVIVMWSGTLASIPSGWALCDGQNGTPDLRSVFVRGAAAGVDPGATGGSATHGHDYEDVVSHGHTVDVTDPGHVHVETVPSLGSGPNTGFGRDTSTNNPTVTDYSTQSAATGITAATQAPAGSVATGTTESASSEPPFYALAFIQKL
jgi:hypothetical protein